MNIADAKHVSLRPEREGPSWLQTPKFGRKSVSFGEKFGRKSVCFAWKFGRKSVVLQQKPFSINSLCTGI